MPTHQVSQNRCFLEAWRFHDRCRVRLLAGREAALRSRSGTSPPPRSTTRTRPNPPLTGFLQYTGKILASPLEVTTAQSFSDLRSARLHCLFAQTNSTGQRAPGVEFGQQQRQGRRLVVLAIGAPTLVSQFSLLVEVGVRPHFLAFWRRSLQVLQRQEAEVVGG